MRTMRSIGTGREEKFEGEAQRPLPDLRDVPGVARVVNASPEDLDAVYYDTADLALLRGGCTLRRGTGGHDTGWHLRTPARDPGRREVELPLDDGGHRTPPEELAHRIRGRTRGREVAPVAHLHTHRERRLLVDAEGRTLAGVAGDHVSAQILDGETANGAGSRTGAGAGSDDALLARLDTATNSRSVAGEGDGGRTRTSGRREGTTARLTAWSEVGVELDHGDGRLLAAVGERLRAAGLTSATEPSRLRHALEDAGAAPPVDEVVADPKQGTAAAAVLARLRAQGRILLDADVAVRADDPDAVHRMRVAARRLRAVLQTHRRLFLKDRTRHLDQELAWLRATLGKARDHEMLAERLVADANALYDDPRVVSLDRGCVEEMASYESLAHRSAWREAAADLDGERYFALLDALDVWLADPPFHARARKKAAKRLEQGVRGEHRRLAARMDTALSLPPGTGRDQALHSARRSAKRLRYAAETARLVVGRPAKRLAERAKALQGALGAHQDTVVARDSLPALADQAHVDQRNTFVYGLLYARLMDEADRQAREVPAVWDRVSHPKVARLR